MSVVTMPARVERSFASAERREGGVSSSGVAAVVGRVRLLVTRRLQWLEHLSTIRRSEATPVALFDDGDDPEAERAFYAREPALAQLNQELGRLERDVRADRQSPIADACETFGLSEAERDVLHVCLACALEPSLLSACGYLNKNLAQSQVSEALVARLCGHAPPLIGAARPLLRWRLVHVQGSSPAQPIPPLLDRTAGLFIDPYLLDYACGHAGAEPALIGMTSLVRAHEPLEGWPVQELCERIERAWQAGASVRVVIVGPPGSGRRTLAACVAAALGQRVISVDVAAVPEARWTEVSLHALRQSLLLGNSLVWCGAHKDQREPPATGTALQFVTGDVDLELTPVSDMVDEWITMPKPNLEQRRALWRKLSPSLGALGPQEIDQLAERYRLQVGDIAAIGRRGIGRLDEAREECRKATRHRLGELGQLLGCPFARDDLMLPARLGKLVDEFLFEAHERIRFWEDARAVRLFPRGRALVALMTGLPGTGKTMAAQVIAAELGLDLFRIDLATSVSKYIGETAKNLRRIFARASEMNAVLLFDEADALFSKRTDVQDAHDRYANTDTNYLLQLIEDFDGIAVLASNKRHNMDAAFVRRIRYVLDFPSPEPAERLMIWRRLTGELAGPEREQALLALLGKVAEHVELSGAQIKLALLAAVFAARQGGQPLHLRHIYVGIDRELSKVGRALSPKDRERIERHDG